MTLEEAIEGLYTLLNDYQEEPCPHEENALKLGIEAGKRVQQCRFPPYGRLEDKLPGETED